MLVAVLVLVVLVLVLVEVHGTHHVLRVQRVHSANEHALYCSLYRHIILEILFFLRKQIKDFCPMVTGEFNNNMFSTLPSQVE